MMFLSPHRHLNLQSCYVSTLLVSFLLVVVSATSTSGQVGGIDPDPGDRGTGGRNTIQGTIFLPGGRRFDRRAKVKLVSNTGSEQFRMSDTNGAFSFLRLQGGTYTVIVDAGKEYEIHSETVDVIVPMQRRSDPGSTQSVYVTLQPRRLDVTTAPATVDATTAGVSEAARKLYGDALESAQSGDRKKAIEQLKQAIGMHPNFMTALNELGVQYIAIKQYKDAVEALRAAIKITPDAFHPRLNYGIVLLHLKDYKGAAAELNIALQKDGASGPAHFYLGRAMVSLGNYDAAETALRQTIKLGGEEAVEAHRYLGAVYIEKRDNARAADELDTYLKLAPKAKDADRIRVIVRDLRSQASTTSK
jgi:Tfp pilus assembly protein PilF